MSPHFVIELTRSDRLDALTVVVEARPGTPEEDWAGSAHDLTRHIKNLIGVTSEIKVVKPGTVERSAGKAKRVIDLRGKN